MKKSTNKKEGIISISSRGTGYVAVFDDKTLKSKRIVVPNKNMGKDPEINFRHLNTALHGDIVEIMLHPKGSKRQTAEVLEIISRAKNGFTGILEKEGNMFFLKPDDTKMYTDILIPKEALNSAKIGQKVFGQIVSWKDSNKAPIGKITKVLGEAGHNDTEMYAIALERGFDEKLPKKVEDKAKEIKKHGIQKSDYKGRRDFRKTLTFTIDPADAKDFDDAISFKQINENEYEIGIHIADVSHYVKDGDVIDQEAYKRGTSVYLVDRTIPMLPEVLSNDLCSLVPFKDRLAMSTVFIMNKKAKIISKYFGKTVIHSKKRLSYEEAEKIIKDKKEPLHKELTILNTLAKKLNKERFEDGALSLDQEEVKFILNNTGVPIKVIKKERGDSNKLIEEFMLLANKKVAEIMSIDTKKENEGFIYRIHDLPNKERMEDLAFFLRSLGYKISIKDGIISTGEINNLLEKLSNTNEKDAVSRAVIRSMAKAIYSTKNIGHYGLAFKHYTHFTSPIRRYPDIIVHRMLSDYLKGIKINKEKINLYEEISIKASEQEKYASEAERASIKYKQVEYMSSRLGQKFEGIISGITQWGIYVEEIKTKCEGLIKIRDINDDFYIFDEKHLALIGQGKKPRRPKGSGPRPQASGKKVYKLGDRVKIKVKNTDLEKKTVDYVLV